MLGGVGADQPAFGAVLDGAALDGYVELARAVDDRLAGRAGALDGDDAAPAQARLVQHVVGQVSAVDGGQADLHRHAARIDEGRAMKASSAAQPASVVGSAGSSL